ncbi:hypothetical protein [Planococcus beigongshangi]|uniref:hypothetical protein n=1 Tax=Planococcus beigongshangi TaxID=2782536 RepID=UPI00193C0CCF|nr:hypothetical protein [Planococcus beigongshangi]
MLSLLLITMLFGTLVPVMQKMQGSLDDKQLRLTAYETMHEAAKTVKASGAASGKRTVNSVEFIWEYGGSLCVMYTDHRGNPVTLCEG